MRIPVFAVVSAVALTASLAFAQQAPPPTTGKPAQGASPTPAQQTDAKDQRQSISLPGFKSNLQWRVIQWIDENHVQLIKDVEVEKDDWKLSADEMDVYLDKDLVTAKGNVTFTTATERISAESLEFNTKTKLGVFNHASGSAQIEADQRSKNRQFGSQETQVLFYGETIEKIGYRKFKITKGGFTTCVQATPRWMLTSSTVIINVDHYALLKNALVKVKGVPVLYLPIIYYPINKEDRATGFLMPAYGTSTLRGTTISNAFFWVINRSQDATFFVDWFSKTGYGYGTEYRRLGGDGSSANLRLYRLIERPTTYTDPASGRLISASGRQNFQVTGSAIQSLPFKLKARAHVDYFSSAEVQQTYNFNILAATQSQRVISGGVSGSWGSYSAGMNYDRSQYFSNSTQSTITGFAPQISFSRSQQPLFGSPVYFAVGGDFSSLVRQSVTTGADGVNTVSDTGIQRFNMSPRIRFPFTKWPFLTVNTSIGWNFTRWNESLDATGARVAVPINRSYFDLSAQFVGPVFSRIFLTPRSKYAEKLKHTIEPWFNIQRLTKVDNFAEIVKTDTTDYTFGGMTQLQYGLNTRVYAKRRINGVVSESAEQIFNLAVRQTYYSDPRASAYDPSYLSSTFLGGAKPQSFSPISLTASLTPAPGFSGSFQTEYNTYFKKYASFGASGTFTLSDWFATSVTWSKRNYVQGGLIGLSGVSHYLSSATNLHFNNNKIGGFASFNWDLQNNAFLQKRFLAYYNVQCCGIIVEYQAFNFGGLYLGGYRPRISKDHRFTFGITLAGVGTFSNLFGALGGGTFGVQ